MARGMRSPLLSIGYLADHPHALADLAAWHYGAWAHLYPDESQADFAQHLKASAQRAKIPLTLVALYGGRLAGSASLVAHDLDSYPALSPWLANVYVAAPYRCQGIATALIERIIHEATNLGLATIYLYTTGAPEFYSRRGWRELSHATYQNHGITIMLYHIPKQEGSEA